jgi:ribosomal peptide maturation radical SAM protein 1
MPFCTTRWPSLGISLLKSQIHEAGFEVDVKYFNINFAQHVPIEWYENICLYSPELMGERLFAEAYFGNLVGSPEAYDQQLLRPDSSGKEYVKYMQAVRPLISPFLNDCLEAYDYGSYDVVGFTTMFEQNLASIALASLIKQYYPSVTTVFGGANCSGSMGLELHRSFPCIDYVFRGEADTTFPEFLERLDNAKDVQDIRGIVYRNKNKSYEGGPDAMTMDLNSLSTPDYDDYFTQIGSSGINTLKCEEIHMETSRGCWWGEKQQCKFCGLNGNTKHYRSKQPENVLKELKLLTERYCIHFNIGRISMMDNVLDMKYFHTLLPILENNPPAVDLFFEIKSNLTKDQVEKLAKARICWVQPGIESLSDNVLNIMNKGVKASQNLQLLKHLKENNIYPTWNIIYGFPFEKEDDYRSMTNLIYLMTHLDPPEGVTKLALQRFSPYFIDPERYGFINIRPEKAYNFVYPFPSETIDRLAYFFDYDYSTEADSNIPQSVMDDFFAAISHWNAARANGEYLKAYELSAHAMMITDTRSSTRNATMLLTADQKEAYQFIGNAHTLPPITAHLQNKFKRMNINEESTRTFLDEMVNLGLAAHIGDKYIALATTAQMPEMTSS